MKLSQLVDLSNALLIMLTGQTRAGNCQMEKTTTTRSGSNKSIALSHQPSKL